MCEEGCKAASVGSANEKGFGRANVNAVLYMARVFESAADGAGASCCGALNSSLASCVGILGMVEDRGWYSTARCVGRG